MCNCLGDSSYNPIVPKESLKPFKAKHKSDNLKIAYKIKDIHCGQQKRVRQQFSGRTKL